MIKRAIDLKHHIDENGQIVKTGKDGCNDFQLGQIDAMIDKFKTFASANPQTMKQPGITRGL